jgi:peptidyl-prolyl cis-trans isomerase SurA
MTLRPAFPDTAARLAAFGVALLLGASPCVAASMAAPHAAAAGKPAAGSARKPGFDSLPSPANGSVIVAVVNGDVISAADVDNRRRLFALTTGLPVTQDVLDRLTPQVTRQLVEERLRFQEIKRRKIIVTDQEIADAITDIETSNGMPAGALRARLASQGVALRTLYDQIRVQIGWGRVLREVLGARGNVSDADIAHQAALIKAQTGQPEFNVGEIFVPISDPAQSADANRFAETVIQQLRAGAPFAVMAAEFSQAQNALQGGSLGWVQPNALDPAVLKVLEEMPVGAISNPIAVPGGLSIVTLRAKRIIGNDPATMVNLRQALFRFTTPLDPAHPTDQQRQALEQARKVSSTAKSCDDVAAAAKTAGDPNGGNPGDVRLETVAVPALRQIMATLPIGKASEPLVANDGVAVMMVCSREQKNIGIPDRKQLADQILAQRVELASRQEMRELERRAMIDRRS